MTSEARHHTSGPLALAIALAATAGFVDAFIFVRVAPVFVANMSGNLIRLGIATGAVTGHAAEGSLAALGGFFLGVVIATSFVDRHVRRDRVPNAVVLLLLESVLLASLPVIIATASITYSATIEPIDYLVVVIGATAMGIQAVALRRVGDVAVSTTYGTGAVVRLGEKVALALRGAERTGNVRRRRTIAVLGTVLVSYVGGAALAAAVGSSWALLIPPAMVPLVAAFVVRREAGGGAST
ncbi:MAG: hypothetical protein JWM34_3673 [Ilumatobacteraceae bacterium]|nr:hypothetical protein [Ilumatobacteraceae bacterium]